LKEDSSPTKDKFLSQGSPQKTYLPNWERLAGVQQNGSSFIHPFAFLSLLGSCHKRQKPQAPTPQAPIRHRQTRKVANAKGLNRNTNLI